MPTLEVHPAWRLAPRFDLLDVEGRPPLGRVLGEHFGIHPRWLHACDRDGRALRLDDAVPVPPSGLEGDAEAVPLAVSTRPPCHALGWFEEALTGVAATDPGAAGRDLAPPPAAFDAMTAEELRVGRVVTDLGLGLAPDVDGLLSLAESFPPVPPGHEASPYRFFLVAAVAVGEPGLDDLARLDAGVETLAALLAERLRIATPDALDLRLHLLVDAESAPLLAGYFSGDAGSAGEGAPVFPGAVRRGWRRVVVHPCLDAADRLHQTAHLARAVALETADDDAHRRVQEALGSFYPMVAPSAGRGFGLQRVVTVRPVEEHLRETAEALLLERLGRRLGGDDDAAVSSGRSTDLAREILVETGLVGHLDGGPTAWGRGIRELVAPTLAARRVERFGRAPADLDRGSDEALREWLETVRVGGLQSPLSEEESDRLFRTLAVDAACRLRGALEDRVERDVFPAGARPRLSPAQFFDALETLDAELGAFADRDTPDGGLIRADLRRRAAELEAAVAHGTARLLADAEPLFSKLGRWLGHDAGIYTRLGEVLDTLETDRIELDMVRRWDAFEPAPETEGLWVFADQLLGRFAALAEEAHAAHDGRVAEAEARRRTASLGALEAPRDAAVDAGIAERLRRAVDELPLVEALSEAVRDGGELRNLFRAEPDAWLTAVLDDLLPRLRPVVTELAAQAGSGRLPFLLDAALRELFVEGPMPATGADGLPGSFDDRTCLLAFASPRLLRQLPDLETRLREGTVALPGVRTPPAVHVVPSELSPGVILARSVQGLSLEEVTP